MRLTGSDERLTEPEMRLTPPITKWTISGDVWLGPVQAKQVVSHLAALEHVLFWLVEKMVDVLPPDYQDEAMEQLAVLNGLIIELPTDETEPSTTPTSGST